MPESEPSDQSISTISGTRGGADLALGETRSVLGTTTSSAAAGAGNRTAPVATTQTASMRFIGRPSWGVTLMLPFTLPLQRVRPPAANGGSWLFLPRWHLHFDRSDARIQPVLSAPAHVRSEVMNEGVRPQHLFVVLILAAAFA